MIERAYESATLRLGSSGPLVVALYRGATTKAQLLELDAFQATLLTRFPHIMSVSVMGQVSVSARLDDDAKAFTAELSAKYEKVNVGNAMVVRSTGLGAVVVRSFLSAFFLMRPSEMRNKVFRSIDEGFAWLQGLPDPNPIRGLAVTAAEIEAFCDAP